LLTWTERILSLPVRTAAVAEFLRELSAKGWGDLNNVLTTFNDTDLCREALDFWLDRQWIVRAPSSPLSALVGPAFSRELTLHEFCGEEGKESDGAEDEAVGPPPASDEGAEGEDDEDR
jgi:hypothetical protein